MEPISKYCKLEVNGWDRISAKFLGFSDEIHYCSFINKEFGIQLICDINNNIIHVSLAPIVALGHGATEAQIEQKILDKANEIIREFFENLKFTRMPDSKKKPSIKHYFYRVNPFSDN